MFVEIIRRNRSKLVIRIYQPPSADMHEFNFIMYCQIF